MTDRPRKSFMLLDGSYVMSQTQVAEVVGKQEFQVLRFLGGKQTEALPSNDFKFDTFDIALELNEAGTK